MKTEFFRSLLVGLTVMVGLNSVGTVMAAELWPQRPVKIVVPYPPGGSFDRVIRSFALSLEQRWGQPVIIDNKPGANEAIGVQTALSAPADGYTLLAASDSALVLNPLLNPDLKYQPSRDLVAITQLVDVPMVLVVPAASPARNVTDFVELARQATASKRDLAYGSSGVGGVLHLAMASFAHSQKLKMTHIPYKGSAEMLNDLVAERTDAAFVGTASAKSFADAGRLRILGVAGSKRLDAIAAVPALSEAGITDTGARFYVGLLAKQGTPREVVDVVAKSVAAIVEDAEFRSKNLAPSGMLAVGSSPAGFDELLRKDRSAWESRIRDAKIDVKK